MYRAQLQNTGEYVEGYPVVIEILDCKDPGNPKTQYVVQMYTRTRNTELHEILGTNSYAMEPECLIVNPETLVCISDKPDDMSS